MKSANIIETAFRICIPLWGYQRLTVSPDCVHLCGKDYYHDARGAYAFTVLNNRCVLYTGRTHPFIFNALHALCAGEVERKDYVSFLDHFDVMYSSLPTEEDLAWYNERQRQEYSEIRLLTSSGRIWTGLRTKDGIITVISYWPDAKDVKPSVTPFVLEALDIPTDRLVYVEYSDSEVPALYQPVDVPTRDLHSELHPELSHKEIVSLMIKSHTSPHELKPWEREVVKELRGSTPAPDKGPEYLRRIGDVVALHRELGLLEDQQDVNEATKEQ